MKEIRILSEYIAPWALAREEIPAHLLWDPSFSYDSIHVELPPDLDLKRFFNVESYTELDSSFEIQKLITPNFFGFTVASREPYQDYRVRREIRVTFLLEKENPLNA